MNRTQIIISKSNNCPFAEVVPRLIRNWCVISALMFFTTLLIGTEVYGAPAKSSSAHGQHSKKQKKKNIAGVFFDEQYAAHGFNYAYPDDARVKITNEEVKAGRVALQFDLIATEFSGGSICRKDAMLNLRPYIKNGALQFWIKGATGGEKAWVALVDEDEKDKHKTVVRVDIGWFGKIGADWSFISIPLKHFGEKGVYWDDVEKREIENTFDWDKVTEFRIEVRKGENTSFRAWVDNVMVTKSIR